MTEALLLICPEQPECTPPSVEHLASFLASTGLIGEPLEYSVSANTRRFLGGEKFLDLIAFLGCSPNIKLEPDKAHQSFCHVNIVTNEGKNILFRQGRQTTPPRCPGCRKPLSDWRELIAPGAQPEKHEWRCPACGQHALPWRYDWRKMAGFGRCFIEITDIYPKEALPQPSLLEALKLSSSFLFVLLLLHWFP